MMTLAAMLMDWLSSNTSAPPGRAQHRPFETSKELCDKDLVLVDMLNGPGSEEVCYCVCDPGGVDCPIIFASDGFCNFTGYSKEEIEGRNCRFLQGVETNPEDVGRIRSSIAAYTSGKSRESVSVNLLNYRKDGTAFCNEFFLAPLCDNSREIQYLIGVQCHVPKLGAGQAPSNLGFVLLLTR